jgi:hypothetical protein
MIMKEKVLDALKALGFETKDFEIGYGFEFEGSHFLYLPSDDEQFLSIALPSVHEFDEENELEGYKLMNKVNRQMKYVKATRINGDIWLFFERNLLGDEDLKEVLQQMIFSLEAAHFFMQDWEENAEDDNESDEDEDDNESDEEEEDFESDEEDEDSELEEVEDDEFVVDEDISEEEDTETEEVSDLEAEFRDLLNKFIEKCDENGNTDSKKDNSDEDVA